MRNIFLYIFLFLGVSCQAQDINIFFLDLENSTLSLTKNFDKDFFRDVQTPALIEVVNDHENDINSLIFILVEQEFTHVETEQDKIIDLLKDISSSESQYQTKTHMTYWDDQLKNMISNKTVRDAIIAALDENKNIKINFILNNSAEDVLERVKTFFNDFVLIFDLYNDSSFRDNFSAVVFTSYMRGDSQEIINLLSALDE